MSEDDLGELFGGLKVKEEVAEEGEDIKDF